VIGHTGAEIRPVKGLRKNWLKDEAQIPTGVEIEAFQNLLNMFNFSSKAKAKAAKYSANPLLHRFAKSLIFSLKDGSTTAGTNNDKLDL
jgi:hypothetical protein